MKPYRLLSTAALAVLFAAGAASAQNMKKDESPAAQPRAQQSAPAEKIAPSMQQDQKKAGAKPAETTGQAAPKSDAGKSMEKEPAAKNAPAKSGDADMKGKAQESTQVPAGSSSPKSSQSTTTQQGATTGQGAASGAARLSVEQRTRITTIIKQQKVQPAQVNFSVSVGAKVPANVRFYPLPVEVVTIYPEWRGFLYILVGNEILVVHPRSHEIVAILEA